MKTDSQARRWAAVRARDLRADGTFWYAVRTTGVFCRPSCGARLPKRENVEFYPTAADARRRGFRPCLRCRPEAPSRAEQQTRRVVEACRAIEQADAAPTLRELASKIGTSAFHLHRTFKAVTGITPKEYASARRAKRVRAALERGVTITDAVYEAGFQSAGRFYAHARAHLGMAPASFRAAGAGASIRFAVGECWLGSVLVACSDVGLCHVALGDDPDALIRELEDRYASAQLAPGDPRFLRTVARVVGAIETGRAADDLPLDIRGTVFEQRVWRALREIPRGTTVSYRDLARRIGQPTGARAVARACASNGIAVLIPCHRVVAIDGELSGYRWGVARKRALLGREAIAVGSAQSTSRPRSGGRRLGSRSLPLR